jgi:urease accessory protein
MLFSAQAHSPGSRTACFAGVRRGIASLSLLLPGLAAAHSGGAGVLHAHALSVQAGWLHPFSGVDHLLAMVALGAVAALRGGRSAWLLPAVFLVCLAAGGIVGMAGVQVPAVEAMVALSLLAFGAVVVRPARLTDAALAVVVGCFAAYHGLAHGGELPAGSQSVSFACGFLLASAMLHLTGKALAAAGRRAGLAGAIRVAGGGIAAMGLVLLSLQVA